MALFIKSSVHSMGVGGDRWGVPFCMSPVAHQMCAGLEGMAGGGRGQVAAADLALGRRHRGLLSDGAHRGEFWKAGSRDEVVWSPSVPRGSPKPSPTQLFFFFFLASASLLLPILE